MNFFLSITLLLSVIYSGTEKNFNLPFDQFATPIYAGAATIG